MNESSIFGVSVRGWLAVIVVLTVCLMSYFGLEVKEPLNSIALLSIGYYFGQKGIQKNGGGTT